MATAPQEDHTSKWRTTENHTPGEMMSVYRELFFAGLPSASVHPVTGAPLFLPQALVRTLFEQFGPLSSFSFDERRGVGRATFESGDDAETCFLGLQFSYLPLSFLLPDVAGDLDPAGSQFVVMHVEFAEYLPFINPLLVVGDIGTQGASMSRQMLRTCPRRRRYSETSGALEQRLSSFLEGVDVDVHVADLRNSETDGSSSDGEVSVSRKLARHFFDVALPESVELGKPESMRSSSVDPATATTRVTSMDLWHAYYRTFVSPPLGSTATALLDELRKPRESSGGAAAAPPFHQQVWQAVDTGLVHLLDPVELAKRDPDCLGASKQLFPAVHTVLFSVRSKDKKGHPLPRRVPLKAMLALGSRVGPANKHGVDAEFPMLTGATREAVEDVGGAWQWVASFLMLKACADDEPLRDVALSAFVPPFKEQAKGKGKAQQLLPVRRLWSQDLIAHHLRSTRNAARGDGGDDGSGVKEQLFKDPRLTLPCATLNVMYRAGTFLHAAPAMKLIDSRASSGYHDALMPLCAPVTMDLVRENDEEARRRFGGLRIGLQMAWLLFRVPLAIIAAVVFVSLGIVWLLGTRKPAV